MNDLTLTTLSAEINSLHRSAEHHVEQAIVYAARCGQKLIEAKAKCEHGEWLPWLKANCEVGHPQATKYMRLAKEMPELIDSNIARGQYLPSLRAGIALLAAPEEVQADIKDQMAEGQSFTEG